MMIKKNRLTFWRWLKSPNNGVRQFMNWQIVLGIFGLLLWFLFRLERASALTYFIFIAGYIVAVYRAFLASRN
jgi:hypothetical protein